MEIGFFLWFNYLNHWFLCEGFCFFFYRSFSWCVYEYVGVSIIAITQMEWQLKWIEVNANIVFSQVNADANADANTNTDVSSFIFPDQRWKWLDSTWNKHQLISHQRPFDYACNHFDICIMSKTFVICWKNFFFHHKNARKHTLLPEPWISSVRTNQSESFLFFSVDKYSAQGWQIILLKLHWNSNHSTIY